MRTALRLPLRTLALAIVVASVLVAASPSRAHAAASTSGQPTSGELVERPSDYDGKRVTFAGEAIGEMMRRGDFAWIHINDDAYMHKNVEEGAELGGYNSGMAVWVSVESADKVTTFGDYKHEGDVVQLTGTFNAACAQHGGDMDIHAEDLVVLVPGHRAEDPVHTWKIWLALGLTVSSALFWYADRRQRARELKGWLASSKGRG